MIDEKSVLGLGVLGRDSNRKTPPGLIKRSRSSRRGMQKG